MEQNESSPQSHEAKIPFSPAEFGMEPDLSEEDDAVVAMSEGDMKLFLAEWGLAVIERNYNEGDLGVEEFHSQQDAFFGDIESRRQALGLPGRPNYPSS